MIEIQFERLRTLGLTPALAKLAATIASDCDEAAPDTSPSLELLRLTEVHRDTVRLHDGADELSARALPRLTRALADEGTALAVGDWVLAETDAHGQIWLHARVPPLTHIARRDADGRRHPVVSNVDTALLVMGLDDDFNPRRLERYLALVHASGGRDAESGGITPAVVLTKADVVAQQPGLLAERIEALRGRVPAAIDLFAIDGTDPYTVQQLQAYLGAGQTLVVLGSSGAGKSTLTNTLLGHAVQDTGAVREHDSRGKHTTTARSLHRLPGGACVIDTPGLRALRPDVDETTLAAAFGDIVTLAAQCRFRDCKHVDEPGCAVRQGVPADRVSNYHKLLREARRDTMSVLERQQQLAMWKARGRAGRERVKQKRDGA
ncbi:MAG: ribosome small subunit-dependent GTPase A [Rhizobiales bacterium]|nr:ribosome small subunit-dependent GTPase A [Rhizobacter sp.]